MCGDFTSRSEGCVSNMIKSLDWDSLTNRRRIHRLTVFQQARQGHLSLPVETLLQPVQRHSRHLHSNAYNIISTNKDCMKHSFFPRTIIDWNSLPEPITNISSIHHLYRNSSKQLPTYEKRQKQTKQLNTCAHRTLSV